MPTKGPLADAAYRLEVFRYTYDEHPGRRRVNLKLK
jgi:hypothetical protein